MTVLFFKHDDPTVIKAYDSVSAVLDNEWVDDSTIIDTCTNEIYVYDIDAVRDRTNTEVVVVNTEEEED
jgi:hypothetical protein